MDRGGAVKSEFCAFFLQQPLLIMTRESGE